jgi:hypothetical protein
MIANNEIEIAMLYDQPIYLESIQCIEGCRYVESLPGKVMFIWLKGHVSYIVVFMSVCSNKPIFHQGFVFKTQRDIRMHDECRFTVNLAARLQNARIIRFLSPKAVVNGDRGEKLHIYHLAQFSWEGQEYHTHFVGFSASVGRAGGG